MQLAGFILLLVGMMVYNNLVFRPFLIRHNCLTVNQPSMMLLNSEGEIERNINYTLCQK